jgi:hypothetical protein
VILNYSVFSVQESFSANALGWVRDLCLRDFFLENLTKPTTVSNSAGGDTEVLLFGILKKATMVI